MFAPALEQGALTADEVGCFERDVNDALDRGDAFLAVTMLGVLAMKDEEPASGRPLV